MTLMTRQQIITMAMNLNDETEDKPGFATGAFIYNQLVDRVADSLAGLDALYVSEITDIVSGQSAYSIPALYRVGSIVATWVNGVSAPLAQLTPQDMDIQYPTWRTQPAQGFPTTAIFNGQASVVLYPQPDYTLASGLRVEGFGVPSTAGAGGASLWPLPTDVCPLPQQNASACIAFGVAARRCAQHPSPENNSRKGDWTAEYRELRAKIFKEVTESNTARRAGDAPETLSSSFVGAF